MLSRYLIVTPQASFGAYIRKGLPEDSSLLVTADFSEAIQFAHREPIQAAILDADLEEAGIAVLDIGIALHQIRRDVQLILAVRADQQVQVKELPIRAKLVKPVSLTELQQALGGMQAAPEAPAVSSTPATTPMRFLLEDDLSWLNDVSRAARHLTRLTLESSAQAALITNHTELWAYAGQLSREAAQELASSIYKYWDTQSQADIMKFIHLEATEAKHMLYAKRLTSSMILAMVFDAETPFSKIRSQATNLVRSLSEIPEQTGQINLTPAQMDVEEEEQNELEEDLPPISSLLGEVPPPMPVSPKPLVSAANEPQHIFRAEQSPVAASQSAFSRESSPAMPVNSIKREAMPSLDQTRVSNRSIETALDDSETEDLEQTRVHVKEDLTTTRKQEQTSDQSVIDTRPQSVTEVAHRLILEPTSPSLYNLSYACLILPRFDHHYLTGDLAERISARIPKICVAYGWRLEHLSIRPEYLQFVVSVPPQTAPGYVMRIIRQQTSETIFVDFPRIKTENPSGDFWAPGYLMMGGVQALPQQNIREFIRQTRQHQGLIKP